MARDLRSSGSHLTDQAASHPDPSGFDPSRTRDINPDVELSEPRPVTIDYVNWRGEQGRRRIMPTGRIVYGATEWHPRHQWLLEAMDLDKSAVRLFAFVDMQMLGRPAQGMEAGTAETEGLSPKDDSPTRRDAPPRIPDEIVEAIEKVLGWHRKLHRDAGYPADWRDSYDAARTALDSTILRHLSVALEERNAAMRSQRYWSGEATRAADALAEARADQKAAEESNDALNEKLRSLVPHETCACSYDRPGDVCMHHSPALSAALVRAERAEKALAFYADDQNYRLNGPLDPNSSWFEGNTRARAALSDPPDHSPGLQGPKAEET